MQELQHTGKLKIENYGLWEFLQDFQQGVSQGYELDESNEGFPQVFGSLYTCLLKPKALKQSVEGDKTPSERIFEEVIYLRKELKEVQEKTVNGLALNVKVDDSLVTAPKVEAILNTLQKMYPNNEQPVITDFTFEESKDEMVITSSDQEEVKQEVTPDVEPVVKRGPKPKNK